MLPVELGEGPVLVIGAGFLVVGIEELRIAVEYDNTILGYMLVEGKEDRFEIRLQDGSDVLFCFIDDFGAYVLAVVAAAKLVCFRESKSFDNWV